MDDPICKSDCWSRRTSILFNVARSEPVRAFLTCLLSFSCARSPAISVTPRSRNRKPMRCKRRPGIRGKGSSLRLHGNPTKSTRLPEIFELLSISARRTIRIYGRMKTWITPPFFGLRSDFRLACASRGPFRGTLETAVGSIPFGRFPSGPGGSRRHGLRPVTQLGEWLSPSYLQCGQQGLRCI